MKNLAVVCGSYEEFRDWSRERRAIAASQGFSRCYPVWSMDRFKSLRGIQIDNFTCYGTWHLLKDRDEIIDRLEDTCPAQDGLKIRPESGCSSGTPFLDQLEETYRSATVGNIDQAEWEGVIDRKSPLFATYGGQPRYGINPPGSTVKYDPGAIFPKDLFTPNPREEAITELTAIARRMSQANLDQLVGIAKDIQALHPAKKEEADPMYGVAIGAGFVEKFFKTAPRFQFGFSGFKDAMSVQSEMDRIQSLTQEIMSVPLPNILPEEKS